MSDDTTTQAYRKVAAVVYDLLQVLDAAQNRHTPPPAHIYLVLMARLRELLPPEYFAPQTSLRPGMEAILLYPVSGVPTGTRVVIEMIDDEGQAIWRTESGQRGECSVLGLAPKAGGE